MRYAIPLLALLFTRGSPQCTVSTLAGPIAGATGAYLEGVGTVARFNDPRGLAIDGGGYELFVADAGNARVRAVVLATGATRVLTGNGTQTSADGVGTLAAHARPYALAGPGAAGLLYVTDRSAGRIRRVNVATRAVTTIAGRGVAARVDGLGAPTFTATFSSPSGLFLHEAGNVLYVSDVIASSTISALVRRIDLGTGQVTTLAGSSLAASASYLDGLGTSARFQANMYSPWLVGTSLFLTDSASCRLRVLNTTNNSVATVAGSGTCSDASGAGLAARFNGLDGVVANATGWLFIIELNGGTLRRVQPGTYKTDTLAFTGAVGNADGPCATATINSPNFLALDPLNGNLYASDTAYHNVRAIINVPLSGTGTPSRSPSPSPTASRSGSPSATLSPAGLFFTPCAFTAVCLGPLFNVSAPTPVATQAALLYAASTNYFFQAAPAAAGYAVTVAITSLSTELLGCGSGGAYSCDPFYVLAGNAGPFSVTQVTGAGVGILQNNLLAPPLGCPTAAQCTPAVGTLAGAWGAPISMQLFSDAGNVAAGARVMLDAIPCPAGSYCPYGAFAPAPCPAGSYCPAASAAPVTCPASTSSPANSTSAAACSLPCPAGSFCPGPPGAAGACPAGTYSGAGASACAACAAAPGSFCAAGSASAAGTPCPPGSFCVGGAALPVPCAAGLYGSTAGLSQPACSGACARGYFCALGSTSPMQAPCGAGNYCPQGTGPAPLPCPSFGAVDALLGPANGPAFDVDTAACLNHCYSGGDGQVSAC